MDFSIADVQVTFTPAQTRRCVNVPYNDDNVPEGDEMFNVVIQNSTDVSSRPPSTTKITIIDDDRGWSCIFISMLIRYCLIQALSLSTVVMLK